MTVNKDEIYDKYKSGKLVDFVFSYLLNEYHCQPKDFLHYESPYETAIDILEKTTNNSDKEYAKRIIDDFFCDIQRSKKGKNSVSWL
jgi:hypothetical protein